MTGHHPHGCSAPDHSGRDGERGAGLVEFAFVAIVLVIIAAGTFDYGMAWRTGLAINEAARTATRVGSALGPDDATGPSDPDSRQSDYFAMSGAIAALDNSGELNNVTRVVIFRSDTADGVVPSACKTATSTAAPCTIMTGAQFRLLTQPNTVDAVTGCPKSATATNWCPNQRTNVQLNAEYYGVWIRVRHDNTFNLISSGENIDRQAVMRIEPKVSQEATS